MPGSRRPLGCRRRAHRPHSERGRRTRPWSGIVPRHHAFRASSGPADRRTRHAGGRARAAGVRLHSRTRPAVASSRRPAARIVHRPEGARCSMMPGHRSNAGRHRQAGAAGPGRPDARMEDGRQGMSGRVPGRSAAGLGRCVHRRVPAPTVQSGIGMPQHAGKPFMMPIRTGATACPGLRTGTGQPTQDAHSPYFVSGVCHAGGGFAWPCSDGRCGVIPISGPDRVAPALPRSSGEPCRASRKGPVHGVAAVPAYGAALQALPAGAAAASPIP